MIDWTQMELLILAFDHRTTFTKKMLGVKDRPLTAQEKALIMEYKRMIFEGFKSALNSGVPEKAAGLLVDEEFGAGILREARKAGLTFAMPVEKSGQKEFDYEYGADFGGHIEDFDPTLVKVLVRYNPKGDQMMNRRQLQKLKSLSEYLHSTGRTFLFELLVPPTEEQLVKSRGSRETYDLEMRPKLMVKAMREIQEAGIEPNIWKLEGVERSEDARATVMQAQNEGRKAAIITLGRGANKEQVQKWLTVGARTPGIIGFAVGRTIFWEPLTRYREGSIEKEEAIEEIARNYLEFANLWLKERTKAYQLH